MRLPRILGEALHIAATLPARVWCGLDAAIHGPQPTAWLQARILLLEERVRHVERERDEARTICDAWRDVSAHNANIADARGQTILRLQHRLTRWKRRYRRAMASLRARRAHLDRPLVRRRDADESTGAASGGGQ